MLVIGGGITGAGAALDAASRGLRVALVEARDLASGTSCRSSKLFHGGLRYLEQRDFKLVSEALRERDLLVSSWRRTWSSRCRSCTRCTRRWSSGRTSAPGWSCTTRWRAPSGRCPHHRHLTARGALRLAPGAAPRPAGRARCATTTPRSTTRGTRSRWRAPRRRYGAIVAPGASAVGLLRPTGRGPGDRRAGAGRGDRARVRRSPRTRSWSAPGCGPTWCTSWPAVRGRLPGADVQGRAPRGAADRDRGRHRDDRAHRARACCSSSRGASGGSSARPTPTGPATGPSRPRPPRTSTTYWATRTGCWPGR